LFLVIEGAERQHSTSMKAILSISSQVAGALVGNSVAAFAMERLGVRVMQIPTVLFGRRPDRGLPGGGAVAASLMRDMVNGLRSDGQLARVDAVLSGYLAAPEQVDAVLETVEIVKSANPAAFHLCDPIMGDEDGPYVTAEVAAAIMERLVPRSDWLAPNIWELSRIAGNPCTDVTTARAAARRLGKPALISSIPTVSGLGVLYVGPTSPSDYVAETPRIVGAPKGAGDLLTALFLARRVRGESARDALRMATGAVYDVIARSLGDDLALPEAQDLLVDPQTRPPLLDL
jgi:pyridoxine kinase